MSDNFETTFGMYICMYVSIFQGFTNDHLIMKYIYSLYSSLFYQMTQYFIFILLFVSLSVRFPLETPRYNLTDCTHLLVRLGTICKYYLTVTFETLLSIAEYYDPNTSLTSICFSLSCFLGIVLFCSRFNFVSVRMQF